MWDLDQIIAQNNQAAIDYMMRGREVDVAQSPQPKAWSLSLLAQKLRVGPPQLSILLQSFTDYETLETFLGIIRRYLPEHEDEILSVDGRQRAYKFCYLFGKKYFPLPPYAFNSTLEQLTTGLPVELMAMSYSAYHELDMRRGYLLLLSLVIYPYEGHPWDQEDDNVPFDPFDPMKRLAMEAKLTEIAKDPGKKSEWQPTRADIAWVKEMVSTLSDGGKWIAPMGFTVVKIDDRNIELIHADNTPEVRETVHRTVLIAEKAKIKVKVKVGKTAEEKQGATLMEIFSGARVPLIDKVQQTVGAELASLIPRNGWMPEELHQWTDGTQYDGVGTFADWVCSRTGRIILDYSYADCEYIEGMGEPIFQWSQFNVDELTKEAPKVKEIREKIDRVVEWLEADPIIRFRELIVSLTAKAKTRRKKATKRDKYEYDPTEHWCPLDQLTQYEEEEEDYGEDEGEARLRRATADDLELATSF
ncbi:hypothetical protein ES703_88347 [subsurface metagenome]